MTYGRAHGPQGNLALDGAAVSHSAELVRGNFLAKKEGPLIRPSGTFSPRGEGPPLPRVQVTSPHRLATG
jgi:hypothetical protein